MAANLNTDKEGNGMTDRQFLNHLEEILEIAKSCQDIKEFIHKLENLIEKYKS